VNFARHLLGFEISRCELGRCEQQGGPGVDGHAIFLFRPRKQRVVGPQPRLDMGYRQTRGERSQGRSERARRVALNDDQGRGVAEQWKQRGSDRANMQVRVFLAWATEPLARQCAEPELFGIEIGMLTGQNERGRQTARGKRRRDRRELDGFRSGPDDQPNVGVTQPSP
jgi:hypothetical protein